MARASRASRSRSAARVPGPGTLARQARRTLRAEADPGVAKRSASFFKPDEQVPTWGLAAPQLHGLARELGTTVRGSWSYEQALEFCRLLLCDEFLEPKTLGLLVLSRFQRQFPPALLGEARGWLERNLCNSWAVCDLLSRKVLAPLLGRHPELVSELAAFAQAEGRWLRRASAVALTRAASRGDHLDAAYRVAETLVPVRDHLVEKANGWLLREAGVKEPRRLEAFLLAAGPRLSRTTVRYALERLPEPRRQRLLAATRSSATGDRRGSG